MPSLPTPLPLIGATMPDAGIGGSLGEVADFADADAGAGGGAEVGAVAGAANADDSSLVNGLLAGLLEESVFT